MAVSPGGQSSWQTGYLSLHCDDRTQPFLILMHDLEASPFVATSTMSEKPAGFQSSPAVLDRTQEGLSQAVGLWMSTQNPFSSVPKYSMVHT